MSLKSREIVRYGDIASAGGAAFPSVDWSKVRCDSRDSIKKQLKAQLDAAVKSRSGKLDLAIIYVGMHGVVNEKNEACLLPSLEGASLLNSDNWLPVSDLLDALFPENEKESRPKKTLLLLDCNRIDANWNMGVLYNDFAERLKAAVEKKWKDYGGLVVINSTSPGQIGWAAPELKGSVFGYYLWKGLAGRANNDDNRVSLSELQKYLRENVNDWALTHRGVEQTPMLLENLQKGGKDFSLVYAPFSAAPKDPIGGEEADKQAWKEIGELWKTHARLYDKRAWRYDPLDWAHYQRGLLRLEQLAQAGEAYQAQYAATKDEVVGLAGELARESDRDDLEVFSLPLARSQAKWDDNAANEAVAQWTAPRKPPASKPASAKAAAADASKNKPAKTIQPAVAAAPQKSPPYRYAAAAAWSSIVAERDPSRIQAQLSRALQFVGSAEARPEADVIEMHFLRMLKMYLDPAVWQDRSGQRDVAQALKVREPGRAGRRPRR